MATLADIQTEVNSQAAQLDAVAQAMAGIKTQLTAALAGTVVSPETQAQIDAIFGQLTTNKAKIAAI